MHFRIVQITKPYLAPLSYNGPAATIACCFVYPTKFDSHELAHEAIEKLVVDLVETLPKHGYKKDWYIVIQCF